jgi:hypothetical protein
VKKQVNAFLREDTHIEVEIGQSYVTLAFGKDGHQLAIFVRSGNAKGDLRRIIQACEDGIMNLEMKDGAVEETVINPPKTT